MNNTPSASDTSLKVNFARAQRQLQLINDTNLPSSSPEYQKQAQSLVDLLRVCEKQVDQLSLFSVNETIEDYSAAELKLVLVNAYFGEALQKISPTGDGDRSQVLEEAMRNYRRFLATCQGLEVTKEGHGNDNRAITIDLTDVLAEGTKSTAASKTNGSDPGKSRMEKIARFKRQREMQQEISQLETKLAGSNDSDKDDMDEVERDHAIKLIQLKILQVAEDLDILKGELKMAQQVEEMKRNRQLDNDKGNKNNEWRLDQQSYRQIDPRTGGLSARPVFNNKGQPMQPFVLTNERQNIKESVFRPGWALPTMSVDEYLKQEQERGNIISGGGKEPDAKPEIDDNDYEALDAETMKQREWDEFADNNPRGAGNTGGNRG